MVSDWHTHGADNPDFLGEIFSPDDKIDANNKFASGVRASYLATPRRKIMVFFPAGVPGTEEGITYTYTRRSQ
jgi:hypothetical protein